MIGARQPMKSRSVAGPPRKMKLVGSPTDEIEESVTGDNSFALEAQYFDNELDNGKFLGLIYDFNLSGQAQSPREMTLSLVDDPLSFPIDPIPTSCTTVAPSSSVICVDRLVSVIKRRM
ncbi:hypothetical protein Pst134EA_017318 [Puccinia striiformis f. sp. tritici]|uniref:hypothetical protein n=1 Tax=Puccinia striiformis f. sp. tritici TaxID=168172 RepID=UPI002008409C|nr:hypothetical protein Pst134EA_017318 [Puccinia striiformis f. sp. tritici]KAH9461007.1 hypothetical protein Pst134EA_017318 [Puccinia striiformis f. sp. tritici]